MHTFPMAPRGHALRTAAVLAVAVPLLLGPGATTAAAFDGNAGPVGGSRLTGGGVVVDRSAPALPYVPSRSWVVADAATGNVLAARGPHVLARPASTLKTLLALTVLPRLNKQEFWTATREDANVIGSKVGLVAGRRYLADDLFYALFLKSGNDAANMLARIGSGGSTARGIQLMQDRARRLQARDTVVVNPNGLDEPAQYSSAYDLALWGRAAVGRADVRRYSGTSSKLFPSKVSQGRKQYRIYTTNRLLGSYRGAFGVKTGYTTLARNTLIAAATRNGRTIVVTLMGSNGATAPQAARLLDWAFANRTKVRPVGRLVDPLRVGFEGVGTTGDTAVAPAGPREQRTGRRRRS
ncbi:MAG: D-alanyl-D-alanine carboxypeptidase family protein [Sporichthyaceae bacterium]